MADFLNKKKLYYKNKARKQCDIEDFKLVQTSFGKCIEFIGLQARVRKVILISQSEIVISCDSAF